MGLCNTKPAVEVAPPEANTSSAPALAKPLTIEAPPAAAEGGGDVTSPAKRPGSAATRSPSTKKALAAALDAAQKGGATEEERAAMSDESGWSIEGWVNGIESKDRREIKLINLLVADAVQLPLSGKDLSEASGVKDLSDVPQAELAFIQALGRSANPKEAFLELLSQANLQEKLATALAAAATKLAGSSTHTTAGLHSKFAAKAGFSVAFGGLSEFHSGLEGLLGAPNPKLLQAMDDEHRRADDSAVPFTSDNYGVHTTAEVEWLYVVAPASPLVPAALARLGLDEWPQHGRNFVDASYREDEEGAEDDFVRQPRAPHEFDAARDGINARLRESGFEEIGLEEQHAGRLYTGPLYLKYNAVLRALTKSPFLVERFQKLCGGNQYCTTIHVINSAILKLSRLMTPVKVYRGMAGGMLPPEFFKEKRRASFSDARGHLAMNGVVEFGFMSTTVDRDVAVQYAENGAASTVFEIQQGMIDRGADMRWLSQYPTEAEILFAPLTALEVTGTHVQGDTLLVQIRLSVNMASGTIAEVVSRRRKLVRDMCVQMRTDLELQQRTNATAWEGLQGLAGATLDVRAAARELLHEATAEAAGKDADHYNGDEQLSAALLTVVDAKMGMSWPGGMRTVLSLLTGRELGAAIAGEAGDDDEGGGDEGGDGGEATVRSSEGPIWARMGEGPLVAWAEAVAQPSLVLQNKGLGPKEAGALALLVRASAAVEEVDIFGNQKVGPIGVRLLASAISTRAKRGCSTFKLLNLRCCGVGAAGAQAVAEALATEGCALECLNLEYNQIDAAGVAAIATAVGRSGSRMRDLDLKWNTIGDAGAAALAATLSSAVNGGGGGGGQRLQVLNLLQCSISDAQAAVLAVGIATNTTLVELELRQNAYGASGFDALWRAAVACASLTLCKMDAPEDDPGAELVKQAAAAKQPPLVLELALKERASTGSV